MKFKFLLMVLLTMSAWQRVYGQCSPAPGCIQNSGMEGPSLPAWGQPMGTTLPNWYVLSGTPVYAEGVVSSHGVRLNNSTGYYTCYNFQSGRVYKVCFMAYVPTSTTDVTLEAHNGSTGQTIGTKTISGVGPSGFALYTATFTATANTQLRFSVGSTGNAVVIDDVGVLEIPVLTASASTINGCGASTLNVTSNNTITWSPSSTLNAPTGNKVTAKPCQTTVYTATYTSPCSQYTCNSGTLPPVTITVVPGVSATASPSTIGWNSGSTLTASSINTMSVTWSPTTGLTPSTGIGSVVTARPCKTTTYVARFRCSTNCQYDAPPLLVKVVPNDSIVHMDTIPCNDTIKMHYSGTTLTGMTFQWIGPKGNTLTSGASLQLDSTDPTDQGLYTLIVTHPLGCKDTLHTKVVMRGCCDVRADFNVIGCNPVRFENTSTSGGVPIIQGDWHWDLGTGGGTSTLRNPAHLYNSYMGPNEACLTVVHQGQSTCCDKICKPFNVCDFEPCATKAAFDFRIMNPGIGSVQFLDKSVGVGSMCNWQWKVNGVVQTAYNGVANPTITLGGPGTYSICLMVTTCPGIVPPCSEEWCEDIVVP
jgi:hypothetical protein